MKSIINLAKRLKNPLSTLATQEATVDSLRSLLPNLSKKYESVEEKQFLEELFPTSSQKKIVVEDATISDKSSLFAYRKMHHETAKSQISLIYAFLENGDVISAERTFHKIWRATRMDLKSHLNTKMINRFIQVWFEKQLEEFKTKGIINGSAAASGLDWYNNMKSEYGCSPNSRTFALMISYYLETNMIAKCTELVDEMEKELITVDDLVNNSLFSTAESLDPLKAFLLSIGKKFSRNQIEIGDLLISVMEDSRLKSKSTSAEEPEDVLELKPTDTDKVKILRETLEAKQTIKGMEKYNQQIWLENRALTAAREQFEAGQKKMPEELRRINQLPKDLISTWHTLLQAEIEKLLKSKFTTADTELLSLLRLVPPEVVARVTITCMLRITDKKSFDSRIRKERNFGEFTASTLAQEIGKAVEVEYNMKQLHEPKNQKILQLKKEIHQIHCAGKLFNMALRKAMSKLTKNSEEGGNWNPNWGTKALLVIGSRLMDLVIKLAHIPVKTETDIKNNFTEELVPAFTFSTVKSADRCISIVKLHPHLIELISNSSILIQPWSLPMVIPPLPWLHSNSGGYLHHRFPLVRTGKNEEHDSYIKEADKHQHLQSIMRALDVLGSTAWNINRRVYQVAALFWNSSENFPGIPSIIEPPEIAKPPEGETDKAVLYSYQRQVNQRKRDIGNAFSERCTANYKLEIAKAFLGETIYFPHNVDFRGRAYPLPPHLNHLGDDLSRGLLTFAEKRQLGERGLWWLKVHISNLYGFDKAPLNDRFQFTENNLDKILDSARHPADGERWWLTADKPWQFLAACFELDQAYKLDDPTQYESSLPVHQDGSCNGLQHYAALGGDVEGATAVNLVPADKPDDIYTQVSRRVQVLVDEGCEKGIPEAIMMKNKINRKLVKQTVMTNTYGVTYLGAARQIEERIKESNSSNPAEALSEIDTRRCSLYIAKLVFECMTNMFRGAKALQIWLTNTAKMVTQSIQTSRLDPNDVAFYEALVEEGVICPKNLNVADLESALPIETSDELLKSATEDSLMDELEEDENDIEAEFMADQKYVKPKKGKLDMMTSMTWTTPLGFPIVQPYRKDALMLVKTYMKTFTVWDKGTRGPVNSSRQASAFPPNFVHSLDASHMFLTASTCAKNGIVFASVHDSYWTHACDIDKMNSILRECFITLHSKNIMGKLVEELHQRYEGHRVKSTFKITKANREKVLEIAARVGKKIPASKQVISLWVPLELDPLPKKGDFDIQQVRNSTYFFH